MLAHIDADAFFASVLQRKNPALAGKPLLALGMGGGCVIAASYEAKAKGVKTGMRFVDARKLVPHAVAVPSDFGEACKASSELEEILRRDCAIVEKMSVDEWFADLRSRPGGEPRDLSGWAKDIQSTMKRMTALNVSVGVGPSKTLAKMASEYRKPSGITIVTNENQKWCDASVETDRRSVSTVRIAPFLQDRPAAAIPGIGSRRSVHAQSHRWHTAWDIAQADSQTIKDLFGRPGLELQRELNGEYVWKITEETAPPKSISRCRSFRASGDETFLFGHILSHLTRTLLRMRGHHLGCKRVAVWLRDSEYRHRGADRKLPRPMQTEDEMLPYIKACFRSLYSPLERYTQAGFGLYDLQPQAPLQYSLFEDTQRMDESEDVQEALDDLHERFGRDSVVRGPAVGGTVKRHGLYVLE